MRSAEGIEIEELRGISQAREVEQLQMAIWKADAAWVVPSHVLVIVSEYGGILLGARIDGALAGFVLGFLARSDGTLFHASHMLGVLPECRRKGVGAALKWRQREVARTQGLNLMRWTFDPLEARNASLNLHTLGAVCRVYRPDYYGPMRDDLNRDLPSDRLVVEWHLTDDGPRPEPAGAPLPLLREREGNPELHADDIVAGEPLSVEIPRDIQTIKRKAPDLALAWRLAVRQAFAAAVDRGYEARDFREGAYILLPQEGPRNET